jgi:ligand-binding sensor domain-containing protein/signal transduction histidine kinase
MKSEPTFPVVSNSAVVCLDLGFPRIGGHGKRIFKPERIILLLSLISTVFILSSGSFALDPGRSLAQYRLVRWDEEQGLAQTFDRIVQTQDGFIWLRGTQGLIRFDGKNFASSDDLHANIKLPSEVYGLVAGRNGELWFGSRDSLYCRLASGQFKRFDSKDGLPDGESIALLVDSEGTLWIWAPERGLVEFKEGHFSTCPGTLEMAEQEIYSISETPKGYWVATTLGAYRIDKGSGKITKFTQQDGLPADQVYAVTTDRRGRVWVATENGLARFDANGRFQPVSAEIGTVEIQSMITDSHGMIWAAGRDLSRIEPETGQVSRRLPEPGGRVPNIAYIYEDREGNIWASTNLGLERLSDVKFTTYTVQEGLSNDEINVVTAGASGRIWIGTMDGLACLVGGRIEPISLTANGQTPVSTSVYSVYEDPQGVLWFGLGDTTLVRSENGRQQQVATLNRLPHTGPCWATGMQTDGNGDLWVGTGGAGLLRFRDSQLLKAYGPDDGLQDPVVYSLAIDHDQRLWISEREGFDLLQGAALRPARGRDATLPPKGAFCLYADSDGTVWAGTRNGLFRFRSQRWAPIAFRPDPSALDTEFYCLLEDGHGNLWSSGSRGIFFVSKSDLNDFFDGKRPSVDCHVFGKADGLKSASCGYGFPQACRSSDGRLWFATPAGLAMIDPNQLQFNPLPPPVQIEAVVVDLRQVFAIGSGSQHVDLGPGAHHLEFDYAGLSFTAPEKVRFKYKLEGFDKDWIDAGTRREAYYTNLSPGTYQFRVIACNNDGLWSSEQAAAITRLTVQPHFYETLWFYVLCAGVVIAAGGLLWRWRLQQILEERTRLSRELHDTVARGSVAVLWQIEGAKHLVKQTGSEQACARLEHAAKLARENLKETRRAMRALRSGILETKRSLPCALEAVLARTADSSQLNHELKVSGTPYRVEPAWEQALVRITEESLTNTLKYARAQRFEAELDYSRTELRLRLRDDGIGFDYQPGGRSIPNGGSSPDSAVSSGLGILGIEERCRQLGGKMRVESNRHSGTMIEIMVPRRLQIWRWRWWRSSRDSPD